MVSISEEKVNKIIDLISEEVQLRRGHPKPAEMDNYFVFVKKTDWWFCYYSILTPDSLKEKTKTLILDELPEDRRKTLKEVFKLMPILIPEAERRKEPFRN